MMRDRYQKALDEEQRRRTLRRLRDMGVVTDEPDRVQDDHSWPWIAFGILVVMAWTVIILSS